MSVIVKRPLLVLCCVLVTVTGNAIPKPETNLTDLSDKRTESNLVLSKEESGKGNATQEAAKKVDETFGNAGSTKDGASFGKMTAVKGKDVDVDGGKIKQEPKTEGKEVIKEKKEAVDSTMDAGDLEKAAERVRKMLESNESSESKEKSPEEDRSAESSSSDAVVSSEELEDSAHRVQKVLNAFHEVTEVLSEVPRQIWMLPIRFGFYPGIKRTQDEIPDLIPFPCDTQRNTTQNATQAERPISVHRLRPRDVKVVVSLGDSLTAANGAMAYSEEETRLNYRGVSAMGGGQSTWRRYLTLPNILKEFSPKLLGYAIGSTDTSSPLAGLNLAENGALDDALLQQARDAVRRLKHDPFIDFEKDWKVVNILIGGNDICNEYCFVDSEKDSPQGHRRMLEATLNYLKARLPRTFVNLIHIPNILELRNLKNIPFVCYAKQLVLCSCLFGGVEKMKAQSVENTLKGYWEVERKVAELSRYDTEEFTVVLQPFFLGVPSPDNVNTIFGEAPNLSLFAPDCFHFSQRSNALIANALWNNMLEPVGNKTRGWKPIMERFICPTEDAPYFYTRRNSANFLKTGKQEGNRR